MSAFVVDPETIGIVARCIASEAEDCNRDMMADLVNRLWEMNERAVEARYGEQPFGPYIREAVRVPAAGSKDCGTGIRFGMVPKGQAFRAIRCYLYQCSEGTVPELELYRTVEKAANRIANDIAFDATERFSAAWK